ncbi:MAG: CHRD domain-containing protein [Chloroflexi bacterium]|nr:CHRD domain-containing protein [Chloroflexota bacterium]
MKTHARWYRALLIIVTFALFVPLWSGIVQASPGAIPPAAKPVDGGDPDAPKKPPVGSVPGGPNGPAQLNQEEEGLALERDWAFYSRRTAGDPNVPFDMQAAARLRAAAADQLGSPGSRPSAPQTPGTFGGAWATAGPNPMVLTGRGDGTFDAMTGRIGALAIRSTAPYTIYLGGAQGGIWISSTATSVWTPKTDFMGTLAIGALALAPSNEDTVYVGTGEGALSGDSYFGEGIYKSTNAGGTFTKISAAGYFTATSISKLVVHNSDENTLYVGTLRGRGGERRTSPPTAAMPFGIWKSTDGGINWSAVLTVSTSPLVMSGVTDLVMDPQNSSVVYASILGSGISKTVDGGLTWQTAMTGLPTGDYATAPSRIALGISHPATQTNATLYAGFEYYSGITKVPSRVYKSTDNAGTWSLVGTAVVDNYCGSQCTYDNVIGVDPGDPNTVYALGLYDYTNGSGGIYRSRDGGTTWVDLGFNLHPDYHAIAIRKDNPSYLVIGNDGGVWSTAAQGGRLNPGDAPNATSWVNLNGNVNPATAVVNSRSGLALGQFTSIATNPAVANRFYGGTQDNGTLRKSTSSATWYDVSSGDGGQVLIDPTDANFVYGTYYGIRTYRFTDGGGLYSGGFTSNEFIRGGLDLTDRSEFYIPWMMDPANPARLYLGTYRVYRTDNAKTANAGDVYWNTVSGDLTSGCTGTAPNGARGCYISAFGKSAGANALYVGTDEGWIWLSTNSTAGTPTWTRLDQVGVSTPNRPIASIAVDASNYRVAYVGFNGFNAATPSQPGHIFKTTNAGQSWTDISNNLPDIPVNSVVLDPADPQTIYIGTDIGPYVTTNGGSLWSPLGSGFPVVAIWQLALNAYTRQIVAGTHGRGAWSLTDSSTLLPALQISKQTGATPVGPGSTLQYTVTVENHGNVTATNVVITDQIPANTTFVAAGSGGALTGSNVVFNVPLIAPPTTVATGGSLGIGVLPGRATVTFTVQIASGGAVTTGSTITNDNYLASSTEVAPVYGSPHITTLAPSAGVAVLPLTQMDGARSGQSLFYPFTIQNNGYLNDSFTLLSTGNSWAVSFWDSTGATQIGGTPVIGAGATASVLVKVAVPAGMPNAFWDVATVHASSDNSPVVEATAAVTTTAVTYDILLVDNDDAHPNSEATYQAALTAGGYSYNYLDLRTAPGHQLPINYLKAHKAVVWFAGMSYPGPLLPYESELAAYLDGGGRIFMSGQDILDQSAGTTPFVLNYLHINWDGTEGQNDRGTLTVTAVITSPFSAGLSPMAMNYAAAGFAADYSDQITPTFPAEVAFLDDKGKPDALQVDTGVYKVIFLGFPFEVIQSAPERAAVLDRGLKYLLASSALTGVGVSGPAVLQQNAAGSYIATAAPISSTRPVRYYWQADEQTAANVLGLGSDTRSYTWSTLGPKTITVTASNEDVWAALSGVNQVPAVNSAATGLASFIYNPTTRVLSYTLSIGNLVGATAAHIHYGAAGVNGGVAHTLNTPVGGAASGAVTLSASDETALYAGGLYVNVHTAANPGGEVRGQIMVTGGHTTQVAHVVVVHPVLYFPLVGR